MTLSEHILLLLEPLDALKFDLHPWMILAPKAYGASLAELVESFIVGGGGWCDWWGSLIVGANVGKKVRRGET